MKPIKQDATALERELEFVKREWRGTQEILGFVLLTTGKVIIPKEVIAAGIPENHEIVIDDNMQAEQFELYVEDAGERVVAG